MIPGAIGGKETVVEKFALHQISLHRLHLVEARANHRQIVSRDPAAWLVGYNDIAPLSRKKVAGQDDLLIDEPLRMPSDLADLVDDLWPRGDRAADRHRRPSKSGKTD